MAPQPALFVRSPSRHPANQDGYDSAHGRYRTEYVHPASWQLDLLIRSAGASVAWTVKQSAGTFVQSGSETPTNDEHKLIVRRVDVPAPGDYEITLQTTSGDNNGRSVTRGFRLRDFLVVGIGDSFASGQGNPDIPAVSSNVEAALCKATSLALFARQAEAFVAGLIDSVDTFTKEKLAEWLPYAGRMVADGITGVEDAAGWIKDHSVDVIAGVAAQVGNAIADTVVEGAEEVASWFGFGDGGEPVPVTHPARWVESHAYRSYRSGQSLAARDIEREGFFGADRVTFLGFGRSGSEVRDGLLGPRTVDGVSMDGWFGDRGQVDEATDTVGDRAVDALVVTIGLNDLGFSSLVSNAILKASGDKRKDRIRGAKNRIATGLSESLDLLKSAVDAQLRPRMVFITEYPVRIFKEIADGTVEPCGVLSSVVPNPATGLDLEGLNLDRSDAADFTEVGGLLNAKLREKANEFGWILIDGIEQGFDGHGYCASRPFYVSAEESCLNQGDFEGMLHPNQAGHFVTRDCIAAALRRELLTVHDRWLEPVLQVMMS